ncbi:MAG TPA: ribonuclease III [Nitrospirota bacterium]|jgi:ribonuclease III
MPADDLKELEEKLLYRFKDPGLLRQALTHKSYANEHRLGAIGHNERLEFLGDTVLDFITSDIIMRVCPESPEGELSKLRAIVVSETNLSFVARNLSLGSYLLLGRGEEQTGGRAKSSLLANAVEAILAAIYIDGGMAEAYRVVREKFEDEIIELAANGQVFDYKTVLQEKSQSRFGMLPKYTVTGETGPDHMKVFEVEIEAGGQILGRGTGKSKKEAEQMAAGEALRAIKEL